MKYLEKLLNGIVFVYTTLKEIVLLYIEELQPSTERLKEITLWLKLAAGALLAETFTGFNDDKEISIIFAVLATIVATFFLAVALILTGEDK
ncbi:hypothetical protein [Stenoxybacter acetivorans]|uniref:hypothetical protein n=1 Tax=Stenoxybacter acetivorans TaxID=422441 RepID=UPI00055B96BE|nr:hypothetical protein [Stenoxybacter acetivorans]